MSKPQRIRMTAAARREVIVQAATEVFSERGYRGASIDEIARRSGVSPPVVYDHFASKRELHTHLLEHTRDELLEVWRTHLLTDEPAEVRVPAAIAAWARYVETHPYAARVFFRETVEEPAVDAASRRVRDETRVALGAILGHETGAEHIAGSAGALALEMAAETMRSGLAGLAIWWSEHPEVAREQVVATAVNVIWIGFERVRRGERWQP